MEIMFSSMVGKESLSYGCGCERRVEGEQNETGMNGWGGLHTYTREGVV
jgi:hypothetical protein